MAKMIKLTQEGGCNNDDKNDQHHQESLGSVLRHRHAMRHSRALAEGAKTGVRQPLANAILVVPMAARQRRDRLPGLGDGEADGARLRMARAGGYRRQPRHEPVEPPLRHWVRSRGHCSSSSHGSSPRRATGLGFASRRGSDEVHERPRLPDTPGRRGPEAAAPWGGERGRVLLDDVPRVRLLLPGCHTSRLEGARGHLQPSQEFTDPHLPCPRAGDYRWRRREYLLRCGSLGAVGGQGRPVEAGMREGGFLVPILRRDGSGVLPLALLRVLPLLCQ